MRRLLFMFFLSGCCTTTIAETVTVAVTRIDARGTKETAKATAVCIYSNERGSVLVTCRHVVQSKTGEILSVWVRHANDWHECSQVRVHPDADVDVAAMECSIRFKPETLTNDAEVGARVVIDGAGPELHKTNEDWFFFGTKTPDGIVGENGDAVIEGDSGGPARVRLTSGQYAVCGIVYGYPTTSPKGFTRRSQHRQHRTKTLYTPVAAWYPWFETQYCVDGLCPIQIRPVVVQPRGLLGVPYGPPRVIGVAEPVPQIYAPVPYRAPNPPTVKPIVPVPDPISITGPPGPPGQSVTQEQVEATVNAWLDSNIDRIRGPKGEPGKDGSTADVAAVTLRIKTLEERPTRVIWADALTRKKLDDITYKPGEPVVLWLPRSLQVSK